VAGLMQTCSSSERIYVELRKWEWNKTKPGFFACIFSICLANVIKINLGF
jgi:hypothetical protein